MDSRGRVSLRNVGWHKRYFVNVEEDGVIVLTPAVVMTAAEAKLLAEPETAAEISEFLKDPSSGALWEGRRSR